MDSEDLRRRPVVLRTGADDAEPTRRPVRYLAWAGTGLLGLVAAAGLVAGGTAVWSAFDPGTPGQSPAPLWFAPPETIKPQSSKVTPTPDDHTRTPEAKTTVEPGDDKGGDRKQPTAGASTSGRSISGESTSGKTTSGETTSGKSTSGSSTSGESTSGKSGSGKSGSSDDGSGHH